MQVFPAKKKFVADERGSLAIATAGALVLLVTCIGAAIDFGRWYSMRSQHANAVDAALLAGAHYLTMHPGDTSGSIATSQAYYKHNLKSQAQIASNSVAFKTADSGQSLTFTGGATINTLLLRLIGLTSLQLAVPAKAVLSQAGGSAGSNIEIAVMLDVTGSMCDDGTGPCSSGTKIDGVKAAATNLANIMLGQPSTTYTSRIALVPFSSAVRLDDDGAGTPIMQNLTGQAATWSGYQGTVISCSGSGYYDGEIWVDTRACTYGWTHAVNWRLMPCVTERYFSASDTFDAGDSVPGPNNWLGGHGGDRFPLSWDSATTPFTSYTGASSSDVTWQWDYSADGSGCASQPGNAVLPLTSDLNVVNDRINSLAAYGSTAGALGTSWVQYMLSPNWSGIWGGSSAPGSYADTRTKQANGAPVLRKVAVLMTDGGFNTFRQSVTDPASDGGAQMQRISNFAIDVCNNMKSNGIEVYTVGFNLNALDANAQAIAAATLQACGSDVSHFYNTLNVQQLNQAFTSIAVNLSPVRLSQ